MIYLVDFLKNLKFFANKNASEVREIALYLLMEPYEEEEMVFDQGDYGDKFYIILKGEVEVHVCVKKPVLPEELEARMMQFAENRTTMIDALK